MNAHKPENRRGLQMAVLVLEEQLQRLPKDDPVLAMRISTALSMAADRLHRAEARDKSRQAKPTETDLVVPETCKAELLALLAKWGGGSD